MAKKLVGSSGQGERKSFATAKLRLIPGKASPGQAVGQALGPSGVPLMDFCNRFNKMSQGMQTDGLPVMVKIRIAPDKTYAINIKGVSVVSLLKKECNLTTCSSDAKNAVARIAKSKIIAIAKKKLKDSNAYDEAGYVKSIMGTAKSCGIVVVDE